MDRGRTAGGGQEPTTPPMMEIKGYNTLKANYRARPALQEREGRGARGEPT
jgi:hypothetical protein